MALSKHDKKDVALPMISEKKETLNRFSEEEIDDDNKYSAEEILLHPLVKLIDKSDWKMTHVNSLEFLFRTDIYEIKAYKAVKNFNMPGRRQVNGGFWIWDNNDRKVKKGLVIVTRNNKDKYIECEVFIKNEFYVFKLNRGQWESIINNLKFLR